MDIQAAFFDSLLSQPKLASSRSPEEFLGHSFCSFSSENAALFHILSGGIITASFPWTFDLKGMDCFILLHTRQGSGKLTVGDQSYSLTASSLLLLNGNQPFRFDITTDPWEYQVFFITGESFTYFDKLLPEDKLVLIQLTSYSDLILALERLPLQLSEADLVQELNISDQLNHIITGCITGSLSDDTQTRQIPSYIRSIRELFDNSFQEAHSLDELEEMMNISKYRLCREFSAAYGLSPLQYLNRRRIEVAAYMLVNSHDRVHEIGSKVGIDNTNHFIHLFKKYMNCTPLEYKQRMTK